MNTRCIILSGVVLALASASSGLAADFTWDGGGGAGNAWLSATNWSPDTVPGGADRAVFAAGGASASNIGINFSLSPGGTQEIGQLVLTSTVSRIIENSSTNVSGVFRFNGLGGVIISNGSSSASLRFRNGSAGTVMTVQLVADSEVYAAGGNVILSNTPVQELGGSWRLIKSGGGALRLGGSNNYSGGTIVLAGANSQSTAALMIDHYAALGTGDLIYSNTTAVNLLLFGPGVGAGTLSNNLVFSSTWGAITNRISSGNSTGALSTLSGLISGGTPSAPVIIDSEANGGRGRLRLVNPSNSFRVARFILNNGGLAFTSDGALGDTNNTLALNGNGTTPDTGLIFDADLIALSPARMITVANPSRIDVQSYTGAITGPVTNKSTLYKAGTGRLIFDAPMVSEGATNSAFVNEGGVSVFNANNTAFGSMTVNTGAVMLGPAGAFPSMTALTVASNALFDASAAGALTMAGSNRVIQGFGAITGDVVLADRARLSPGGIGPVGRLHFRNGLVLDGTVTNYIDLAGSPADTNGHDLVQVDGALIAAGDPIMVNVSGLLVSGGVYRVMNYGPGSSPVFTVLPLTNVRYTVTLDTSVPGQADLVAGGQNAQLRWNGTTSAVWDVGSAMNWLNMAGATNDVFLQSDDVIFDDTPGVQTNLGVAGLVMPASVTVTSSVNEFMLSGTGGRLRGDGVLRKYGSSTLTLALTNSDYSGAIEVRGGYLRSATASSFGTAGGSTLALGGGTLDLNGLNLGTEPVVLGGSGVGGLGALVNNGAVQTNAVQLLTLASNASVGGLARWDVRGGAAPALDLAGFTLTKTGTNIVGLGGARMTNSGSVVVEQGMLSLESLAVADGPGAITVQPGGTLNFLGSVSNRKDIVMNGGQFGVTLGGNGSTNHGAIVLLANSTFAAIGNPMVYAGPITGPAGFATIGPNSHVFAASNSFAGDVLVTTGFIRLGHSGALGASTNVTLLSQTGGAGLTGTRIELFGGISLGAGVNLSLPSSSTGDIRSTLYCAIGTNDWNGAITLNGNGSINIAAENAGSILNLKGPIVGSSFAGTVFFRGAAGIGTITGVINLPGATFSKVDANTWSVSSTGNVWGATAVRIGLLQLLAPQVLPADTTLTLGQAGTETAQVDLGGFRQQIGRLALSSAGGTKVIGNNGANDAELVISGVATSSYGAAIADSFSGGTNRTAVTVENGANVTLSGTSTYSGPTLVSNAWLRVQNSGALGLSAVTIASNGTVEVDSAGGTRTISNLFAGSGLILKSSANNFVDRGSNSFSGTFRVTGGNLVFDHVNAPGNLAALELNGGHLGLPELFVTNPCVVRSLSGTPGSSIDPNFNSVTQTVGARVLEVRQAASTTFDGIIKAGSGGRDMTLLKTGAGSLALGGINTYGGPTFVSNGTLLVNGSIGTGAVTVSSGTTLGGTGTIGGLVTSSGIVAPGAASAGKLTVNGDFVQAAGGTLALEIGGPTAGVSHDWLDIQGAASLDGALSVTLTNGYVPAANEVFLVLSTLNGTSGTFATTNLPALGGGNTWQVDYIAGAVMLTVVNTGTPPPTGYDLAATVITNGLTGYQDDADGDGYANLLEYVTGGSLTNAGIEAKMQGTRTNGLLALRFTRNTNAVDATLIVEGSGSAVNGATWLGIATNIGGSWGAATNVISAGTNSPLAETVYDATEGTNRFLRLRVTRP